uniref:Uncharacterized protein n=2 Tax=Triticum urartu TaxID=4572 RepID=A0A8R7R6J4_TRIUA
RARPPALQRLLTHALDQIPPTTAPPQRPPAAPLLRSDLLGVPPSPATPWRLAVAVTSDAGHSSAASRCRPLLRKEHPTLPPRPCDADHSFVASRRPPLPPSFVQGHDFPSLTRSDGERAKPCHSGGHFGQIRSGKPP